MKARSLEAAGGKPGHAGRSGRAPFFGPFLSNDGGGRGGRGKRSFFGVLGAALLAAALLLAPGGARAADECGALSSGAASCTNQAFASGISYTVASGAGGLGLTVGGGAATTITASGSSHGVALSMGVTTTGNMALTVGSAGAVEIVEDSTASHGIHLRQDGSGTATADIRSGVTIGTASTPMGTDGVRFDLFRNTANKGGDRASLTSGAEIHAAGRGLVLFRAWGRPDQRGDDPHQHRRRQRGGRQRRQHRPRQPPAAWHPPQHRAAHRRRLQRRRHAHQFGPRHGLGRL